MDNFRALTDNLLVEVKKLHQKNELSKNISSDYYEPGMMEYLDKYEGVFDEATGKLLLRFESMGTRYEGRTEQIEAIKEGDTIRIVRDKENTFNPNNFVLMTETNKDVGCLPAALCNVIAPLFDNGKFVFEKVSVSYAEPISQRSRYAKKAVLFVEAFCQVRLADSPEFA